MFDNYKEYFKIAVRNLKTRSLGANLLMVVDIKNNPAKII